MQTLGKLDAGLELVCLNYPNTKLEYWSTGKELKLINLSLNFNFERCVPFLASYNEEGYNVYNIYRQPWMQI